MTPSLEHLSSQIARVFSIPSVVDRTNIPPAPTARAIFCYLATLHFDYPNVRVANFLGVDRTTVHYAREKVREWTKDEEFEKRVLNIKKLVEETYASS